MSNPPIERTLTACVRCGREFGAIGKKNLICPECSWQVSGGGILGRAPKRLTGQSPHARACPPSRPQSAAEPSQPRVRVSGSGSTHHPPLRTE